MSEAQDGSPFAGVSPLLNTGMIPPQAAPQLGGFSLSGEQRMANLSMKTGQKGLALIKEFEGCELKAYRDAVGVLTIGYGHTAAAGAPTPKEGLLITPKDAEDILKRDLGQYERAVIEFVTVPLNQEQFDALVCFTFNLGPKNLRSSTLLKKLNAGDYQSVPSEMRKWVKAGGKTLPGLIRRREAEGLLFATKAMPAVSQSPRDIEPIEPPTNWLVALLKRIFG
ncbi:lysozyme [Microvirga alba]|uniref:Lysozyme n=1 Tax=Microvirga alba TaxID=2791025 RepID=A0A931BXL2_9HYPH|nr:lysozyme [Microvirga alba]MBF9234677.1 lysozyme [Microvirga alba]